jgi:hypothetical protein
VDALTIIVLGGLACVVLFVWVLGRANEGGSMEQFGLRSAREISETREALDAEDLDQMLAAHNARRRARGEAEMSVEDIELRVINDRNEMARRRDELTADRELDELLEATNARRRARGLPERTREQVKREFGGAPERAE